MHDEDSAIGLDVTNQRGDAWRCIGDDYLDDVPAGVETKRLCIEAIQISADEVYDAFTSKKVIPKELFGALKLVPSVNPTQELAPLFRKNTYGEIERRGSWLVKPSFSLHLWDYNIDRTDHTDYTANFSYMATYVECYQSGRWKWPLKLNDMESSSQK